MDHRDYGMFKVCGDNLNNRTKTLTKDPTII